MNKIDKYLFNLSDRIKIGFSSITLCGLIILHKGHKVFHKVHKVAFKDF